MAKSRYQLRIDNFVIKEDFPLLPIQLLEDFATLIKLLLQLNPLNFYGAYRLVYRVYDSPSPRCVVIISFAEHDPAYSRV